MGRAGVGAPRGPEPLAGQEPGEQCDGAFAWQRAGQPAAGGEQRAGVSAEAVLLLSFFSRVWEHGDRKEAWEKVLSAQRINFPSSISPQRLKLLHLHRPRHYTASQSERL